MNTVVLKKEGSISWLLKSSFDFQPPDGKGNHVLPSNTLDLIYWSGLATILFPLSIPGHFLNVVSYRMNKRILCPALISTSALFFLMPIFNVVLNLLAGAVFDNFVLIYNFDTFCLLMLLEITLFPLIAFLIYIFSKFLGFLIYIFGKLLSFISDLLLVMKSFYSKKKSFYSQKVEWD